MDNKKIASYLCEVLNQECIIVSRINQPAAFVYSEKVSAVAN